MTDPVYDAYTPVAWALFTKLEGVEEAGRDLPDPEVDGFIEAAEAAEARRASRPGPWGMLHLHAAKLSPSARARFSGRSDSDPRRRQPPVEHLAFIPSAINQ